MGWSRSDISDAMLAGITVERRPLFPCMPERIANQEKAGRCYEVRDFGEDFLFDC